MFTERTIIYFTPFYFKNGNTAKNKYFVVLKNIDNKSILASLPTSKDYIPEKLVIEQGCIECESSNLNCFVLSPSTKITEDGKCFSVSTYLYGHLLDEYSIDTLTELYPYEASDYQIWGQMKISLFNDLIECLKNSKSVKRKYKKRL
jgi:hypothetical protein